MGPLLSTQRLIPDLPLIDTKVWNDATLVEFLGITLPDDLKPEITAATPLLFRCMQRLGSFPWYDRPEVSGLQLDTLRLAIVFLLCRDVHFYGIGRIHMGPTDIYEESTWTGENATPVGEDDIPDESDAGSDDEEVKRIYFEWYSRLLFQSMSVRPDRNSLPGPPAAVESEPSNEGSDGASYLSRAHNLVDGNNMQRHPTNPKIGARGPPIIPVSELPPSNYRDVSGSIPVEQEEIEQDTVDSQIEKLERVVADVLKSSKAPAERSDVSWDQFEAIARTEMSTILQSLFYLVIPFIKVEGLNSEAIKSSTKSETAKLIHEALSPYF
ncbi:hypothetical protein UCREL1_10398 [Eutypa lata UCREL1]|uniref:Uncharacterized protein n=1 Tax=Eutypa lata (strain UCR-EL1) TaxID=1287681 RepID=M7SEP7_EUTLA|nr:hypothetical protein UCREL1_10398 [Eutypa lata UCREL1]